MSKYVQIQTYATCNQQTLQEVLQRYQNVIAQLGCNDPQALAWILQDRMADIEDRYLGDIYAAPFQLTPDQKHKA